MKHTSETTEIVVDYTPPAIERREAVAGLLTEQRGSYDTPWAW